MRNLEPFKHRPLKSGLYLVATPIGNLGDITLRALEILRAADIVLCEDTRVTGKLLKAYDIKTRLERYNDHSDEKRRMQIVEKLKAGKSIALVSDAGTPLISDPGYKLVQSCQEEELFITSIPGAAAPLSALQLSGLPSNQFCFIGFLPNKEKARQAALAKWKDVDVTLIAFETAPRLMGALEDIAKVFGDRQIAVVREITKLYEECKKGSATALIEMYQQEGKPKGEIVIVMAPPEQRKFTESETIKLIRNELKTRKTKDVAKVVSDITGEEKGRVYDLVLKIKAEDKE
ncbi:MAG: 16S rRNA (cytidine(1402)-2'-O)-methyltransferase [Alphaproteobacteria bacterium]|nr:16S rRNA (cytidine(1402)-2'-O)-methyltransferase [Alphaproteobacteria bacterium]